MTSDELACHCVVCTDDGESDSRDPGVLTTLEHVHRYGWSVLQIPADSHGPGWAFTIGIWHTYRVPEVAVFGLPLDVMAACLNGLGDGVRAGEPMEPEQVRSDVLANYAVHLKHVDYRWYKAFFGSAIAFYRRPPVPFLQVVWPNRDALFPWEATDGDPARLLQPQLWLRPDEHPVGVWTQDI